MSRLFGVAFVCSLMCLPLTGCGDKGQPLGAVTGQVTMDGKPLPNALVAFVPEKGGSTATATTDANGQYELLCLGRKGAPLGKHTVSVTTIKEAQATAEMSSDDPAYAAQATAGASAYDKATVTEPIPARYNKETELVKEVASGSNVINLELTSE